MSSKEQYELNKISDILSKLRISNTEFLDMIEKVKIAKPNIVKPDIAYLGSIDTRLTGLKYTDLLAAIDLLKTEGSKINTEINKLNNIKSYKKQFDILRYAKPELTNLAHKIQDITTKQDATNKIDELDINFKNIDNTWDEYTKLKEWINNVIYYEDKKASSRKSSRYSSSSSRSSSTNYSSSDSDSSSSSSLWSSSDSSSDWGSSSSSSFDFGGGDSGGGGSSSDW